MERLILCAEKSNLIKDGTIGMAISRYIKINATADSIAVTVR